jgi:hypothetical protein
MSENKKITEIVIHDGDEGYTRDYLNYWDDAEKDYLRDKFKQEGGWTDEEIEKFVALPYVTSD